MTQECKQKKFQIPGDLRLREQFVCCSKEASSSGDTSSSREITARWRRFEAVIKSVGGSRWRRGGERRGIALGVGALSRSRDCQSPVIGGDTLISGTAHRTLLGCGRTSRPPSLSLSLSLVTPSNERFTSRDYECLMFVGKKTRRLRIISYRVEHGFSVILKTCGTNR